jgi:hypothetical protein
MAGAASAFVVSAAQFPAIPVLLLIIEQSLQCTSVHGKDAHFSELPVRRFALVTCSLPLTTLLHPPWCWPHTRCAGCHRGGTSGRC